jgi:hypothetical protein
MVSIDSYSLMYDNFGRGTGGLPRSSGRPRGTRGTSLANAQDFCVGTQDLAFLHKNSQTRCGLSTAR